MLDSGPILSCSRESCHCLWPVLGGVWFSLSIVENASEPERIKKVDYASSITYICVSSSLSLSLSVCLCMCECGCI